MKIPVLLALANSILSDRLLLFSFTLYRRVKDPFDGHFCRNTDVVSISVLVSYLFVL